MFLLLPVPVPGLGLTILRIIHNALNALKPPLHPPYYASPLSLSLCCCWPLPMAKMRLSQVAESRRVATLGACVATCVAAAATEQRPRQLPRCLSPAPSLVFFPPCAVCLSLFPPGTLARYLCNGTHFSSVLAHSPLTLPLSLSLYFCLFLYLSVAFSLFLPLSSQLQFKRTFFLATHFPRHMHKQFFQLPFVCNTWRLPHNNNANSSSSSSNRSCNCNICNSSSVRYAALHDTLNAKRANCKWRRHRAKKKGKRERESAHSCRQHRQEVALFFLLLSLSVLLILLPCCSYLIKEMLWNLLYTL